MARLHALLIWCLATRIILKNVMQAKIGRKIVALPDMEANASLRLARKAKSAWIHYRWNRWGEVKNRGHVRALDRGYGMTLRVRFSGKKSAIGGQIA